MTITSSICCKILIGAAVIFGLNSHPVRSQENPTYNVARSAIGTNLFYLDSQGTLTSAATQAIKSPAVLVGDDEVISYNLPAGKSLMVVELPAESPVKYVTFFNDSLQGTTSLSWARSRADADSGKWQQGPEQLSNQNGPVTLPLPSGTTIQFLRLAFDVTRGGRISGLGIAGFYPNAPAPGPENLIRSETPDQPLTSVVSFGSSASIIATTPIQQSAVETMIDDLVDTHVDLAPSNRHRAVLIDLGEAREVQQISTLTQNSPGDARVYFVADPDKILPALGNPAQGSGITPVIMNNFDPAQLGDDIPFINLPARPGQSGVSLPIQARMTRYALFVWPPGANPIRVFELNLLGQYEWTWNRDNLSSPAEGPQIQPGQFSPNLGSINPPDILSNVPLSP